MGRADRAQNGSAKLKIGEFPKRNYDDDDNDDDDENKIECANGWHKRMAEIFLLCAIPFAILSRIAFCFRISCDQILYYTYIVVESCH